jgi:carbamate kinase
VDELLSAGPFPAGSMGPKVAAATQFVERTGRRAAIGALRDLEEIVHGAAGTNVVASPSPANGRESA